jgi:hypothetical protein
MLKPQFPNHFFHAHGFGLGAVITKPFHATVESQAATCISCTGGHAHANAAKFNLRELIRFDYASTQIAAVEEDESYDTVITTTVENINIFNQFTADRIVAHLSIKSMKNGDPMHFRTVGSRFENLRVGGIPIHPVLMDEDGAQYRERANPVYDLHSKEAIRQDIGDHRHLLTTLVSKLEIDSTSVVCKGNAIHVPDFGVVYLAEYLVTSHERYLKMFRIRLGCANDGNLSGSGAGGNGSQGPPVG